MWVISTMGSEIKKEQSFWPESVVTATKGIDTQKYYDIIILADRATRDCPFLQVY